jgi:predicted RNA-binding protein with PUA-like domain
MPKSEPRQYWLMKSEPEAYSIVDLEHDVSESWDGVRNYQARNYMQQMRVGDMVLFYHSNADPPGVMGIARVCKLAHPDDTAFDPGSKYFDPKSKPEAPTWYMVDVEYVEKLPNEVTLELLKQDPELEGMLVRQRGQRLSVQPVEKRHFARVLELGGAKTKV